MDLKKYNSKMLAVLGTMAIVGLGVILIFASFFFIQDLLRNRNRSSNKVITLQDSDEEAKIRDQEVSFGSPKLIDTLETLYIIPVSQVMLETPEELGFLDVNTRKFSSSEPVYRYSGHHSNLILYNQNKGSKTTVFKQKVLITYYVAWYFKGKQFLLIEAVTEDTDKNKELASPDLHDFFIYDIESDKLFNYSFEGMGLTGFYVTHDSFEVILSYGKDKNGNGRFEEYEEPKVLKSVSLETFQSSDLIEESMVQEIQSLVD